MSTMRMGSECEVGLVADGEGAWTLAKAMSIQAAIERMPHLPSVREGVFLGNGSRVYVDQGLHNEYATPEVDSPEDLVVHELAGRRILQAAAAAVGHTVLCANVSPANRTTAGTHENYELKAELGPGARARLFAHLATRIVFTGAGGLDPYASSPRPVLSPRACFIRADLCHQGTRRKSLVFVKPNHHGAGHRLHVFCGESLMSPRASYLKYATTALVAHCLDTGAAIGPGPLRAPAVRSLRLLNRDLDLCRPLELADGRRMTALEIQWSFFEGVMACRGRLPFWSSRALLRWEAVLNALEGRDGDVANVLDWAIFQRAFAQIEAEAVASGGSPAGLTAQGHALYLRMHTLGPDGLFDAWIRSGHVDPSLPEVTEEAVRKAMTTAPPGRAANRADLIARHAGNPAIRLDWGHAESVHGAWTTIPDGAAAADWDKVLIEVPAPRPAQTPAVQAGGEFRELFRTGAYHELVSRFAGHDLVTTGSQARIFLRDYALALARLGRDGEADELMNSLRGAPHRFDDIADRAFAIVNYGLAPPRDRLAALLAEGEALLPDHEHERYARFLLLQTRARHLCSIGRLAEAIALCRGLLASEGGAGQPRMLSRTRCCLAEALRASGQIEDAQDLMVQACDTYDREGLRGDFLDHGLPLLLKLIPAADGADIFAQTRPAIEGPGEALRRARLLAIAARRFCRPDLHTDWTAAVAAVPCLARCVVTQRIAQDWAAWAGSDPARFTTDYWGVA
jgi:proteasome accessory factor A